MCGLAAVAIIALGVAGALGASTQVLSALGTACGLLVPAAADALRADELGHGADALGVEARRKTPGAKAVEDDIDPDGDSVGGAIR